MFSRKSKRKTKMLKNIDQTVNPETLWKISGELGEGSFGMVHKVTSSETKEVAAAKVIPYKFEEELEDFVVEVDILTELKHPSIIGLFGAYLCEKKLWVILELCEGGAMDDILLELESGLNESQIRCIGHQMLAGLRHLHENNVIHRDLKAGNVLLKADGSIKITDFGVSALNKKANQRRDTFIGTPYWMAPEVVVCENNKDKPYDYMADIWSFGITLIEFAETSPPWHDMHPMRVLFKIPKAPAPTLNDTDRWSEDFHDMLRRCLQKSPLDREPAAQLQEHAFVANRDDRAPLRDLFRLFNADVTEVLEDLPASVATSETSSQMSSRMSSRQASEAAPQADAVVVASTRDESADNSPAKPPAAAVEQDEQVQSMGQRLMQQLNAVEQINGAIEHAQRTSKEDENVSKAVGDAGKHFKTLTRTRQYVNETGEIITVSTQRVVETSQKSGKLMTIRRGMVNIDSDWKDAEAKRLAELRKGQLRETKRMQRDEQKECAEMFAKLQVERDQCDQKHRKELEALERDCQKEIVSMQKRAQQEKQRLEKTTAIRRKKELERIASENQSEYKSFKSTRTKGIKDQVRNVRSASTRGERKSEVRKASENAKQAMDRDEDKLNRKLHERTETQTKKIDEQLLVQTMTKEAKLLEEEQQILRNVEDRQSQMKLRHMLEKQQILHHQLKATFWMQKHQMNFRHVKEADQLKRLQEKKLVNLERKYAVDQKLLPRRQRTAASQRKRELKKTLSRSERSERSVRMNEFKSRESTRMRAENEVMNKTYRETLEGMKEAMSEETNELLEMQNTRKQLLVATETEKVEELEATHHAELEEFKKGIASAKQQLEEQLRAQMDAHKQFYQNAGASGADV